MQAFRQAKEAEALAALAAAKKQKREPGQLTINETVKRMRARCTHDSVRALPAGQRGVPRSLPLLQRNPGVRRAGVSAQVSMAVWKKPYCHPYASSILR